MTRSTFTGRGVDMIAAERLRQIKKHGFDASHDDEHEHGELAEAAAAYINPVWPEGRDSFAKDGAPENWPFEAKWYRPGMIDMERLAKAGALIAAEIDRLLRVEAIARRPNDRMELTEQIDAVFKRAAVALERPSDCENGQFAKTVLSEALAVMSDLRRCSERLGEAVAEMLIKNGLPAVSDVPSSRREIAKAVKIFTDSIGEDY